MPTRLTPRRLLRAFSIIAAVALLGLPLPQVGPRQAVPPQPIREAKAPSVPRGDDRFLIVGLTQDRLRTDTIMVIQWDDARQQARILGIPRDIGVTLTGVGLTKLVHAYSTGGIGRTRAAVVKLLDVPIAHYVVFSLPAMRHVVDLIGGVPLVVEKRMVYTDRQQGLFINLSPGPQVLNGARAEQYLRFRYDPEGDIGRIRRQQKFLRAGLEVVRRPAVWIRLPQLIEAVRAEVETDLTSSQLLGWAHRVDRLSPDGISAYTVEGRPAFLWDDLARMKLDFWAPDPDDLRVKVRWLVTGMPAPAPGP